MNNYIEEIQNRDRCCDHLLGTTISKIYFIFSEEEALEILVQNPNIHLRGLQEECWRRWEIMCMNDQERFERMLQQVLNYEGRYEEINMQNE